jgi:hypothetical protein
MVRNHVEVLGRAHVAVLLAFLDEPLVRPDLGAQHACRVLVVGTFIDVAVRVMGGVDDRVPSAHQGGATAKDPPVQVVGVLPRTYDDDSGVYLLAGGDQS